MSGLFIFFYFSARKWNCFFGTFYFSAKKGQSFYGRPLVQGLGKVKMHKNPVVLYVGKLRWIIKYHSLSSLSYLLADDIDILSKGSCRQLWSMSARMCTVSRTHNTFGDSVLLQLEHVCASVGRQCRKTVGRQWPQINCFQTAAESYIISLSSCQYHHVYLLISKCKSHTRMLARDCLNDDEAS